MPAALVKDPTGQAAQVDKAVAPTVEEADPAAHLMHCVASIAPTVARYVPAGQLVHEDLPGLGL